MKKSVNMLKTAVSEICLEVETKIKVLNQLCLWQFWVQTLSQGPKQYLAASTIFPGMAFMYSSDWISAGRS